MTLSTHVLDTARGVPAADLPVVVERLGDDGVWTVAGTGVTGPDGRAADLVPAERWAAGRWRLVFDTVAYLGPDAFLPRVTVELAVASDGHHHVPLLLSPFRYTTYRGT